MARVWRAGPTEADVVAGLLVEFRDWWGRTQPPAESFRRGVERLMADPATEYLLGTGAEGGEAAGVAQLRYRHGLWRDGEDAWLEDLYVRRSERGAGLGRALAEAAVARARERGCVRIQLDVTADNAPARALYERMGFRAPGSTTLLLDMPLDG